MLSDRQDAFGHEMHDYLNGKDGYEVVERDDERAYIRRSG